MQYLRKTAPLVVITFFIINSIVCVVVAEESANLTKTMAIQGRFLTNCFSTEYGGFELIVQVTYSDTAAIGENYRVTFTFQLLEISGSNFTITSLGIRWNSTDYTNRDPFDDSWMLFNVTNPVIPLIYGKTYPVTFQVPFHFENSNGSFVVRIHFKYNFWLQEYTTDMSGVMDGINFVNPNSIPYTTPTTPTLVALVHNDAGSWTDSNIDNVLLIIPGFYSGTVTQDRDETDYYRFYVTVNQSISLYFGIPSESHLEVNLHDPDYKIATSARSDISSIHAFSFIPDETGYWYIRVDLVSGIGGDYNFHLILGEGSAGPPVPLGSFLIVAILIFLPVITLMKRKII